jgi:hypothetical protein
MANALLDDANALGYVTELLSGDRQAPFGRSSHHQVWSEAMVVSPVVRGMLGLDWSRSAAGVTLALRPQLPADWDTLAVRRIPAGAARVDLAFERTRGLRRFSFSTDAPAGAVRIVLAPAVPLDARVRAVTVNDRPVPFDIDRQGDSQFVRIQAGELAGRTTVLVRLDEGTEVYRHIDRVPAGAANRGLRILRARADEATLGLLLEGVGGERYVVHVRTPRQIGTMPDGVRRVSPAPASDDRPIEIAFEGDREYQRREITLPLVRGTP